MKHLTLLLSLFISITAFAQKSADTNSQSKGKGYYDGGNPGLIIVDGKRYKGTVKSLNTYKVAEMHILKPEEAAKLYGDAGKKGVLVVTTDRKAKQTPKTN